MIRWVAPITAAALAIGGGLAAQTAAANPTLPKKSPQELLTAVAGAKTKGLSGTVTESANLGLPSVPGMRPGAHQNPQASSNFSALMSGTHTLKVWTAGEHKSRTELVAEKGESDMIRNGRHGWLWSSADKSATQLRFPSTSKKKQAAAQGMPTTPQQAAKRVLHQIGPSTKSSVARNVTVAGRPAYQLVLQPKDSASLVSQVRIAVDAKTSTPLRVQADAAGHDKPAFSVGFRSVDFSVPDAKTFRFSPPSDAKVTKHKLAGKHPRRAGADPEQLAHASKSVGSGWTQVMISDLNKASKHQPGSHKSGSEKSGKTKAGNNKQVRQMLKTLPKVSGSWGSGRLLSGSLFSAVVTDDGRLAVGAVKPAALYKALNS